jgi:8-oxo-dGTP pyrophosphatase MutT (NUDIX family)
VNHTDYIAASAIIRNAKNQILVQNHVKTSTWTIPIGKVEKGENVTAALARELNEELGIMAVVVNYLCDEVVVIPNYPPRMEPITVRTFVAEVAYTGSICNMEPHKHSELRWVSEEELKQMEPLSEATKLYLERRK